MAGGDIKYSRSILTKQKDANLTGCTQEILRIDDIHFAPVATAQDANPALLIAAKEVVSVHDNEPKLSNSHPSGFAHEVKGYSLDSPGTDIRITTTPYKLIEEYIEKKRTWDCELNFPVNEHGKR